MTRLTVIIPTYNRADLLLECLRSLSAQTYMDFTTLIVDDGSQDAIAEHVAATFPEVEVLRLARNSGFARAVNAGLRRVHTELVLLLNDDMTLAQDCIANLVRTLDTTPADMVAPLVLWRDDDRVIYSAGDALRCDGRPAAIGFRERIETFRHPGEIFGVSAGAGLYRRQIFDVIGLFDEKFVAYFEDADLNLRARLAGFTAAYAPDAVAYHVGSASLNGQTWWRSRQCFGNHALLFYKNMPGSIIRKHLPAFFAERANQSRRMLSSARTEFGAGKALLLFAAAELNLLRRLPYALRKRAEVRRMRAVSPEQLNALLADVEREHDDQAA